MVNNNHLTPLEFEFMWVETDDDAPSLSPELVQEFYKVLNKYNLNKVLGISRLGNEIMREGTDEKNRVNLCKVKVKAEEEDTPHIETQWSFIVFRINRFEYFCVWI